TVGRHVSPQEIAKDRIAFNEYRGKSFNDSPFAPANPIPTHRAEYSEPVEVEEEHEERASSKAQELPRQSVMEMEKITRLVDGLKSSDQTLAVGDVIPSRLPPEAGLPA